MENSLCSAKPNSQSEKEEEKSNESNYFLKDSDVHCQQRTSLIKNTMMEGPSVNIGADLPQAEALISVVPKIRWKRKRKRARSSAPIINNLEPDFSDNTESVPVESRPNVAMKRSHAPKIGDFNPDCLKGALSSENISPENNSCMQYSGRDVHHDSPLGAYTLLEEPSINVISDLVPAELPSHVDLSRRKRKKKKATIGAAPEPENSCLASCAGICSTPNSEKAKQHADLPSLQRKKKRKQNEWRKIDETDSNDRSCESPRTKEELSCSQGKMKNKLTKMSKAHENSYKSCNLFVGTSLVENIMPTVDPSLQPPVTESLEQELAVAQSPVEGISTKTNSESSELIADLSCSRKKKKKIRKQRCKTQETNDESCRNDKICDLSVGTSLVENIMPGIDYSQQPPVSEFSEQKLELPPPLMEGISTKTNSESSGPFADSSCSRKKKKKLKTHESNDRRCKLSVGTLVENIMPGTDSSQQPPVLEFTHQKLELPQPLKEGISTTANSEGPEPNADLSCSQEKKKKNWKRGHKTHESNDRRSDPSLGTSLEGNIIPGADLSVQPPLAIFSEQDLEVEQPLVEGIGKRTNSESPKPIEDLSCSQKMKQKNGKKRRKICESNDETCDPSGDTSLVENIIPGADPYLQSPLAILSEQELEVPQILLEDSTFQEKNEDKEQNKRSNASGNNDTDHDIRAGLPCQLSIDVKADENNNDDSLSEVSKLDPTNIQDITNIEQTETKTEVPSLPPLAVKADVDVAVNVKEGNLSQISDRAAERSLVSCSKKKLLILDINGLLADIVPQECHIPKRYKPDITISRKAVFKRPFCDDFLQFCFDRFNVGVWSSRTKKNVDMVVDFLLGDSRHKLLFCWNQSHCTTTRFNTIDNTSTKMTEREREREGGGGGGVSVRHIPRIFNIEAKEFRIKVDDLSFGGSILITEKARARLFHVSLELRCVKWLVKELQMLVENKEQRFFRQYKGDFYQVWVEMRNNGKGTHMRLTKCIHGALRSVIVPQGRDNIGWVLMKENLEVILTGRSNSNRVNSSAEVDYNTSNGRGREMGRTYKEAVQNEKEPERNNAMVGNSNWSWVVVCERQVLHQAWSDIRLALSSWLDEEVELFPYQVNRAFFVCESKAEAMRVSSIGKLVMEGQTDVLLYSWERGLENNIPKIVSYGGWLGVSGLPMHWWRKDFFERIGNECGGLVELDQRTENFKYLFEARIKTRKNHVGFLPEIVIINEGSESYFVKIRPLSPAIMPTKSRPPPPKTVGDRKPVKTNDGDGSVRTVSHRDSLHPHVGVERGNHIGMRIFEGTEGENCSLTAKSLECGSRLSGIGRISGLQAAQMETNAELRQVPENLVRKSTMVAVKKSRDWAVKSGPNFGPVLETISEPKPEKPSLSISGPEGNCDPILKLQGNGIWAGPAQNGTRFFSRFKSSREMRTLSRRPCASFTQEVRPGHGGEYATMAEANQEDESCDSVDGRSIASVATEDDDLPSEVEETIDVIECDDGSVAGILNGQIEGMALEGQDGLGEKNSGGGNDGDDDRTGLEGGGEHKLDGYVKDFRNTKKGGHIDFGSEDRADIEAEKRKIMEGEDNENQVGDVVPLIIHDSEREKDAGLIGETTKATELVSYSRRKRLGEGKHSRIMAKLNLTIVPIRKQLSRGCLSKSSRSNGESGRKGRRSPTRVELEVDSVQSTLLQREAKLIK